MLRAALVGSLALVLWACGAPGTDARSPEAESTEAESTEVEAVPGSSLDEEPGAWAAGAITSDAEARAIVPRAFREAVSPGLRPERAAIADRWEQNLTSPTGHVDRGPCAELAARVRDSITALGTPDSEQQQILYGSLEHLADGECVSVSVGVGFETLVTVLRPTDGRLLLAWDVPEG